MEPMRELRVRFTGDANDLKRAARDAGMALDVLEREMQETGRGSDALGKKIGELAVAYLSLSTAVNVAQRGIGNLAQMEQAELGFKVLFNSAEKAKAKMQELTQFAASTPFQLPQVVEAAKLLETFGLNSSKYLRDAGDLASAFNTEISEVARALGRINSGDFGEAFERLRDFGISRQVLEGKGLVFDASGSYVGSVDAALTAVQAVIREKFGGMMEEQSKTFTGQMSTLGDAVNATLGQAFKGTFDVLKEEATKTNEALKGELGKDLNTVAHSWGGALADALKTAAVLAGDVGHVLLAGAKAYGNAMTALRFKLAENDNKPFQEAMLEGLSNAYPGWSQHNGVGPNITRPDDRLRGFEALIKRGADAKSLQNYINQAFPGTVEGNPNIDFRKKLYRVIAEAQGKATEQIQKTLDEIVSGGVENIDKAVKEAQSRKPTNTGGTTGKGTAAHVSKTVDSWVDAVADQSVDALELRLGQLMQGKNGGKLPIISLSDRIDGAFQTPTSVIGLGVGDARSRRTGPVSYLSDEDLGIPDAELAKKAEQSLRSGLEAGAAAFLDGGLGGLGQTTYTVSKQALSKALVDAVMGNDDLKSAFGQLGAAIGHPITAAVATAALGLWEIKKAFDQIEQHNQKLEDYRSRYFGTPFGNSGSMEDLRTLTKERAAYAKDDPWWLPGAGIANDAKRGKLSQYDALIPTVAGKAFSENWDSGLALKAKTLEGALTTTQAAVLQFSAVNGLSVEVTNQLVAAKTEEIQAAYKAAKALSDLQSENSSLAGILKSFDWKEKLGGGSLTATDLKYAGIAATGGKLNIGEIDQQEAIRLAELYGLLQYGGSEGAPQYGIGGQPVKSTRQQIVDILGYDPGKDSNNNDLLKPLLDQMVLPLLAELRSLKGLGGATSPVGSLSNPDTALQFDAPRVLHQYNTYHNNFVVQAQAFAGNIMEAREFAREMWAHIRQMDSLTSHPVLGDRQ